MTSELRLILLGIGILIILYIIWDAYWSQKKSPEEKELPAKIKEKMSKLASESLKKVTNTQSSPKPVADRFEPQIEDEDHKISDTVSELDSTEDDLPLESEDPINPSQQQIPIPDFNGDDEDVQASKGAFHQANITNIHKPETVITINIMADIDKKIEGQLLLQELLTLGFKFGDMNIFHRYQHANGDGERWFSLANAFNPGEFDIDNMKEFSTQGLTLFMLIPGPIDPLQAFENMLKVSQKLSQQFSARLEDGSHSTLTRQRIEMYREEIRQYL